MRDLSYYNPEGSDLRILQNRLSNILFNFDAFCKEHSIKYSLGAGTLLGAIRHNGFIPWDDDMDLIITREQYQKLVSQTSNNIINNQITLIDRTIMPRIQDKDGYFIDLLILDKVPDIYVLYKIKKIINIIVVLLIKSKERLILHDFSRMKSWFVFIPLALLFSMKCLQKIHTVVSLWMSPSNGRNYACFCDTPRDIGILIPSEIMDKYCEMLFERKHVQCISEYDKYLKIYYGDYMKIPEDDEIQVHNRILLKQ